MFGTVIESGRLFGGQYLFVVAELETLRQPVIDNKDCVIFPSDFTYDLARVNEVNLGEAAIWGGASKGVIFALLKARAGQPVGTVIDINPAKQGKYLPATGLLVQSPLEALANLPQGSTIYVMNSNYLREIQQMSNDAFTYFAVDHE